MAEILVIDDEPQLRKIIVRVLAGAGHTVHQAPDGQHGLEMFRSLRPALVISDIVMPDGEGIETIRQMRKDAPEIPILAMSGASNRLLYLRAAGGLGASALLEKPFTPKDLLAAVNRLLEGGADI
jgi:CheY-like chemotaxis protein